LHASPVQTAHKSQKLQFLKNIPLRRTSKVESSFISEFQKLT
jgi:hypothetical protein